MPITPVVKPPFPNVPDVDGVPPIPRSLLDPPTTDSFETTNGADIPNDTAQGTWGIYDLDGNIAIVVDTITSVRPVNDSKVSDFPVEEGAFASYNKVQNPNTIKVKVSLGGDRDAMIELLDTLRDLVVSTDLLNVVTPYETYLNVTLEKFDYAQEGIKASHRIDAELSFKEVREVAAQFTNATLPPSKVKNPASAGSTDDGKQQPQKTSVASNLVNSVSNWLKN